MEQLTLFGTEFVDWVMERWTFEELTAAILRYQERTGKRPEVLFYRPADTAAVKGILPVRFDLREQVTTAVHPGHIWVGSVETAQRMIK